MTVKLALLQIAARDTPASPQVWAALRRGDSGALYPEGLPGIDRRSRLNKGERDMEGKSRFGAAVLGLTAGCVLFCAGWFLSQASSPEPWQVSAARRPADYCAAEEDASAGGPSGEEDYPESLLPGEIIDVNTADVYDLQRLPGIGEKRAGDIIAWREEHGPFQTLDELVQVSGIGPGILEGLRAYASAGEASAQTGTGA